MGASSRIDKLSALLPVKRERETARQQQTANQLPLLDSNRGSGIELNFLSRAPAFQQIHCAIAPTLRIEIEEALKSLLGPVETTFAVDKTLALRRRNRTKRICSARLAARTRHLAYVFAAPVPQNITTARYSSERERL